MKDDVGSLSHSKWRCKYHIVWYNKKGRACGLPGGTRVPLVFWDQPSIRMVFFSGTFRASFFGTIRCRTPSSYEAFTSSSVMALPT